METVMLQIVLDALAAAGEAGLTATELVEHHPEISKWDAAYNLMSVYRMGNAHQISPRHGDGIEIRVALVMTPSLVNTNDPSELAAHVASGLHAG